jgi:hypothetical protein
MSFKTSMLPSFLNCDTPTNNWSRRGMRGSLIYCPGFTGDAVATRIFRLTDPDDYPIILESPVLEPFWEYHGEIFRADSLTITPWDPYSTRFDPSPAKETLRSVARWQYQVTQAMTQPPSRAQRCKVFH